MAKAFNLEGCENLPYDESLASLSMRSFHDLNGLLWSAKTIHKVILDKYKMLQGKQTEYENAHLSATGKLATHAKLHANSLKVWKEKQQKDLDDCYKVQQTHLTREQKRLKDLEESLNTCVFNMKKIIKSEGEELPVDKSALYNAVLQGSCLTNIMEEILKFNTQDITHMQLMESGFGCFNCNYITPSLPEKSNPSITDMDAVQIDECTPRTIDNKDAVSQRLKDKRAFSVLEGADKGCTSRTKRRPCPSIHHPMRRPFDLREMPLDEAKTLQKLQRNPTHDVSNESCTIKEDNSIDSKTVEEGSPGLPEDSTGLNYGVYNKKATLNCKILLQESNHFHKPIGIVQLTSGEIVVADTFNDRVVLLSKDGQFVKTFEPTIILHRPSAVVELEDGRVAVKDRDCITLYHANGNISAQIGTGDMRKPYGLALDEAGNLLTLEEGSCGTINILTVCPIKKAVTARVKVELQISYPDIPFSKPRFLAWHSCNTLLVVDLGIDRIFQVDYKMGYCIKSFGTPGKASGQFNDPAGITSDNLGYIYIADSRNHRIQVYDPFLDFACILEKDAPLFRPSGIHVTPNDDLLVINYWENSIAKFNLITKKPMGY